MIEYDVSPALYRIGTNNTLLEHNASNDVSFSGTRVLRRDICSNYAFACTLKDENTKVESLS